MKKIINQEPPSGKPSPVGRIDESQLWERFRQNGEAALVDLYGHLYFGLMNYGIRICKDPEATRDAINDMFLELWDNRHKLPAVTNVRSYTMTYLRRKIMAGIRQDAKRGKAAGEWFDENDPFELPYEALIISIQASEEIREKIRRVMETLTPRQKELVQLRYFDGLGIEDIALKTDMSVKTVYNTLGTAIKALSAALMAVWLILLWCALTGRR